MEKVSTKLSKAGKNIMDSFFNIDECYSDTEKEIQAIKKKNISKKVKISLLCMFLPSYVSYLVLKIIGLGSMRQFESPINSWLFLLALIACFSLNLSIFYGFFYTFRMNKCLPTFLTILIIIVSPLITLIILDPLAFSEFIHFDFISCFFMVFSLLTSIALAIER